MITDLHVTAAKIAANAVTNAKIATDAVKAANINIVSSSLTSGVD